MNRFPNSGTYTKTFSKKIVNCHFHFKNRMIISMLKVWLCLSFISCVCSYTQVIQTSGCGRNGFTVNGCHVLRRVSKGQCTVTAAVSSVQSILNVLGCRSCTQSRKTKCTNSYYNQFLKTGMSCKFSTRTTVTILSYLSMLRWRFRSCLLQRRVLSGNE